MELKDYTLKIKDRVLLEEITISFFPGKINYLLGENGAGKSMLAKDLFLRRNDICLIGSYTNIPQDISASSLFLFLKKHFNNEKIIKLSNMLNLDNIDCHVKIKKLSDGQKQKLKLLVYLLFDKEIVILDEISNAIDRKTVKDIYDFLYDYSLEDGKTIISITHNPMDVRLKDGIYYLMKDRKLKIVPDVKMLIYEYMGENENV